MLADLCRQINLSLRPALLARLSPVGKKLFTEVAFQMGSGTREELAKAFSGQAEKQPQKKLRVSLNVKSKGVNLHLQGFEQGLGLHDQKLAERLWSLLQPFIKDQEYQIKYAQTGAGLLRHRVHSDGGHELVVYREAMVFGKQQVRIEALLNLMVQEVIYQTKESFPSDFWDEWNEQYAEFVEEVEREFEQSLIERGLVRVLEDEMLRQALTGLLYQSRPSQVKRLYALPKAEEDAELQSLLHDVQVYEDLLAEQLEAELRTRCPALTPFLHDWKELIQLIASRTSDRSVDVTRLNVEWKRISSAEQAELRSSLVEYAQVVACVFPLPDWYSQRAEPYLKRSTHI